MSFDTAFAAIPPLDPKGNDDPHEGPTNFGLYVEPTGVVRAVMIFVELRDAPANAAAPTEVARHLLGNGKAQRLFHHQSYQRMTLDVTVESALGWRKIDRNMAEFGDTNVFTNHRAYIEAAAALFAADVNFSAYSLVLVVAPASAALGGSRAFTAFAGDGATSASGEIRLAVTFDQRSHSERSINLVHEMGHLIGLPDLYQDNHGADDSAAGCWPIMSDIFHASGFLGWHRHKNGWLDASRKTYLNKSVTGWPAILHPLSGTRGLSMVVLPIDDATNPSKVYVVELAQPVLGTNGKFWGEGVLLYTVDATIATGSSPVVLIPKTASTSPEYGYLFEAPFAVGDTKPDPRGGASITLKVVRKLGASYSIEIDYQSP